MNISDINAYKDKWEVKAAADLLFLIGPDKFEGDYAATIKDLEDEINTTKMWYVITFIAEDTGTKIVDLTVAEAEGLKRVVDADYYSGGGYCGLFGVSQPYPTYADAQASIID